MMSDTSLKGLLNQPKLEDSIAGVRAYLKKVLDKNEDVRRFHQFLPQLLARIIGSDNKGGWLDSTRTNAEQNAVHELLTPGGPLFRVVLREWQVYYELSFDYLPVATQRMLAAGELAALPPFFQQRLHVDDPRKPASTLYRLKLNMFEYYIYCLLYFGVSKRDLPRATMSTAPSYSSARSPAKSSWFDELVSPSGSAASPVQLIGAALHATLAPSAGGRQDSIYVTLMREYLYFFLPVPLRPVGSGQPSSQQRTMTMAATGAAARSEAAGGPLRRMGFTPPRGIASPEPLQPAKFVFHIFMAELDPRGESPAGLADYFFKAAAEIWCSQNVAARPPSEFVPPPSQLCHCLRYLAIHLGYANPLHSAMKSASDDLTPLTSIAIAAYRTFYRKLYQFLTLCVRHAVGMDAYLPLVVDVWSELVRPWKQSPPDVAPTLGQDYSAPWSTFVLDNFLLYTELPRALLRARGRTQVADSVQDVGILGKVVATLASSQELLRLLRDAELEFVQREHIGRPGERPVIPARGYAASIRVGIMSCEGAYFEFQPFFSAPAAESVEQLQQSLLRAIAQGEARGYKSVMPGASASPTSSPSSRADAKPILSGITSMFHHEDATSARAKQEQHQRLVELSVNLAVVFPAVPGYEPRAHGAGGAMAAATAAATPTELGTRLRPEMDRAGVLTAYGRQQVRRGARKCNALDPVPILHGKDRLVIKSYEIAILVHLTQFLSDAINRQIARYVRYLNTDRGIRLPQALANARVDLRFLAAYQNLAFILVFSMLMWALLRIVALLHA